MIQNPVGRCIGCFHEFATGPCGGCGAIAGPGDTSPSTWSIFNQPEEEVEDDNED